MYSWYWWNNNGGDAFIWITSINSHFEVLTKFGWYVHMLGITVKVKCLDCSAGDKGSLEGRIMLLHLAIEWASLSMALARMIPVWLHCANWKVVLMGVGLYFILMPKNFYAWAYQDIWTNFCFKPCGNFFRNDPIPIPTWLHQRAPNINRTLLGWISAAVYQPPNTSL